MRKVVLAALLSVSLASCTTLDKADTVVQNNLPSICRALNVAHATFVAFSATGKIKASTIRKENAAYEGVAVFCADPTSVSSDTVLIKIAQAYATITLALREV